MRIEKTELEFDEIYKGKVKPIATGGYIPFLKRFIGRIVHIIIPREEKAFLLFKKEELSALKKEVEGIKFPEPYSRQKKETILDAIDNIQRSPEEFELENLIEIIYTLENIKIKESSRDLLNKIKKIYSI